MARVHTSARTRAMLVAQQQSSSAPLLDRSAIPNGVNILDTQELANLWLTIDSSVDDSIVGGARPVDANAMTTRRHTNVDSSSSSSSSNSSPSGSPVTSSTKMTVTTTTVAPTTTTTTKRKPRTFTPLQVDQRRRRNRDSMRRVRQRKQVEVDHLRQQMELLQAKLDELDTARNHTDSSSSTHSTHSSTSNTATATPLPTAVATSTPSRRTNSDVHALLECIKALQIEQLSLHTAVLRHQQVAASLMQIVQETAATHPQLHSSSSSSSRPLYQTNNSPPAAAATDAFAWVDAVLPLLLPSRTHPYIHTLVRESYHAITAHIQRSATSHHLDAHHVLGWRDVRVVRGQWADFHFSKAFHHVSIASVAAKTWTILTKTNQSPANGGFQSQSLQLKVLLRLNDDTLVMARTAYVPQERRHYSSIYLLLRVQTASGGYVIGGRTLELAPLAGDNGKRQQQLQDALGADRTYAHMCYGLQLDPLTSSSSGNSKQSVARAASVSTSPVQSPRANVGDVDNSTSTAAVDALAHHRCSSSTDNRRTSHDGSEARAFESAPLPSRGCSVQYGGRIGNGSPLMAQTWAMDVLLAVLRWENACVQPLYRLTT